MLSCNYNIKIKIIKYGLRRAAWHNRCGQQQNMTYIKSKYEEVDLIADTCDPQTERETHLGSAAVQDSFLNNFKTLLKVPTLRWLYFGAAMFAMVVYSAMTWIPAPLSLHWFWWAVFRTHSMGGIKALAMPSLCNLGVWFPGSHILVESGTSY